MTWELLDTHLKDGWIGHTDYSGTAICSLRVQICYTSAGTYPLAAILTYSTPSGFIAVMLWGCNTLAVLAELAVALVLP